MLTVDEALARVLDHVVKKPATAVELDSALGLVLADDIASDIDSPPHDKAMMDGFAVVAADLADGGVELSVQEEILAGQVPTKTVTAGTASRIMTGAPIPTGADAVVMVERTQSVGKRRVKIDDPQLTPGRNIMPRGTSLRVGQRVLAVGDVIRHIEIGVLAEIGTANVPVIPRPTVAVLPTGDELVPPAAQPAAGQIRNSNGPMLTAAARRAGADAVELEIARDDETKMRSLIEQGLAHDVLLLSGGVSAGVKDLVPKVLGELGVEQVFHKVKVKPGKPLWFGVAVRGSAQTLVFGLPGNPVSSLVCFELFVRPALAKLAGRESLMPRHRMASLTADFHHRGDRQTYYPGRLIETPGSTPRLELINWQGSADLASLSAADALAVFDAGERTYAAGTAIEAIPL